MAIEINSKTKTRVIYFLTNLPKTKENDNLLVGYIWKSELENLGYNINEMPVNQLLNIMSKGMLTSYESIRRIRAKLQSDDTPNHHKFRGANYLKRARKSGDIQDTLFNFNDL